MYFKFITIFIPCILFSPILVLSQESAPIYRYTDIIHPVVGKSGMVATQDQLATRVGLEILKKGGNAIDSAVAIGFALAVTLPRAGNLGGGGFMIIYLKSKRKMIAIDYREKAPLMAKARMFLDKNEEVNRFLKRESYLAIGVPGTVAGLELVLKKYGTMSLKKVIQPAIDLALKGFVVSHDFYHSIKAVSSKMKKFPASRKVFFKPNGSLYRPGETFKQKDLAFTLKKIAKQGKYAFYRGSIAKLIVKSMQKNGGIIDLKDLRLYRAKIRKPVAGVFRDHLIYSMPPPSSGGVHLIQMLNLLEKYPLRKYGHNSSKSIHLMAEAMKLAYADRSKFLGDPDFSGIPVKELTSKKYADHLRKKMDLYSATPSKNIFPGTPRFIYEGNETTHFSVVDAYGNAVSNTYTLNFSYGIKAVVEGTGILLNNQMDDFSAKPDTPNAYGLIGGHKNAIEPEKRMLSSMSPTMVFKDKKLFLVTGTPGGSRIITTVLQILLNTIEHEMNIAEAAYSPRIHHQWLPDILYIEKGINLDTITLLKQKGYKIEETYGMGSTQNILLDKGFLFGVSDPRKPGALTLGY